MSRPNTIAACLILELTTLGLFQNPRPALAAETQGASRYVLLVGVDDYTHADKLQFCGADMRALAERLAAAGFAPDHICLLHDKADQPRSGPLKSNIERELGLVLKRANKNDLVIVAFGGRGAQREGKSYLYPVDAQPDDLATLISVEAIQSQLGECPAAVKLLVLDASRQDLSPGGRQPPAPGRLDFSRPIEQPPEGVMTLCSCGPGQTAHEDRDLGHGVFMHFLLEGLRGPADTNGDGRVSLLELYIYTMGKTKQHVAKKFNGYQTPALRGDMRDAFVLSGAPSRKTQ